LLKQYYSDISKQLNAESAKIKNAFKTHKPTAGTNRESLVAKFLQENLPKKFEISSGLIMSKDGEFSNQADIVVTDKLNNAPLFPSVAEPIWLVESVYALIEVKTQLSPTTLDDSIKKCQRFKELKRNFYEMAQQNIYESLFVLWAFESPSPDTASKNIREALKSIPISLRPDFIIVPGGIVCRSGNYFEISKLGQENSNHRRKLVERYGKNINVALLEGLEIEDLGDNSILAFIVWFSSWLQAAGGRSQLLLNYLPDNIIFGNRV
jgi:hypothetical protein